MSARHSRQQRLEIGAAVMKGRGAGMSWAVLEQVYLRSRLTLWRYLREAEAADVSRETIHTPPEEMFHMKHPSAA